MDGIKLNLGCGILLHDGFINIDNFLGEESFPPGGPEFIKADLEKLPFQDNYADYAEAVEVLEHISFRKIPYVIKEIKRVLKTGAEFRFIVPNFDGLAKEWLEMTGFNMEVYDDLMQTIYGNQLHDGETHQTPFNPIYTSLLMKATGWSEYKIIIFPKGCYEKPPLETQRWVDGESSLKHEEIIVIAKK